MRTTILIISLCLLVCAVGFAQSAGGSIGGTSVKCLCRGAGLQVVRPKRVHKVQLFPPSPFCEKWEIIITMKNGHKKCLDAAGKQGQTILKAFRGRIN